MQLSDARCLPFHTVEATALFATTPRYVPAWSHTGFRFGQVLAQSGHFRSRHAQAALSDLSTAHPPLVAFPLTLRLCLFSDSHRDLLRLSPAAIVTGFH
jgi:hypothetical protein